MVGDGYLGCLERVTWGDRGNVVGTIEEVQQGRLERVF
jgi:hypothetical protein